MDIIIKDSECEKLWHYTNAVNTEIAAWGYVTPTDDGDFFVDHVFLVPQEVSATGVDFVKEGMPYAVKQAIKDDRLNDLRFCWHSHVNMQVGFSSIDEGMISDICKGGTLPWFISVIFNKRGETNGRIDLFKHGISEDINHCISHIKEITLDVRAESEATTPPSIVDDIKKFVTERKYQHNKATAKSMVPTSQRPITNQNQYNWWDDDEYDWGNLYAQPPAGKPLLESGHRTYDSTDLAAMSDDQLKREINCRSRMVAEATANWETCEYDGWEYWFDENGNYVDQTISKEADDLLRDMLNVEDSNDE